eukprot:scaffold80787_cov38-Attheya_sp.AAC.1
MPRTKIFRNERTKEGRKHGESVERDTKRLTWRRCEASMSAMSCALRRIEAWGCISCLCSRCTWMSGHSGKWMS